MVYLNYILLNMLAIWFIFLMDWSSANKLEILAQQIGKGNYHTYMLTDL